MPRLINPGMGDRCDRYTILLLKLRLKGHQESWHRELQVLERECRTAPPLLLAALAQVNTLLWQAEDELRQYRADDARQEYGWDWREVGLCAFRIQALNDDRARLVDEINKQAGDFQGPEKGPHTETPTS